MAWFSAKARAIGQRYAATGLGLSMTMTNLGVVLGPPMFGLVADTTGSYQIAWLYLSCLSVASLAVSILSIGKEKTHG